MKCDICGKEEELESMTVYRFGSRGRRKKAACAACTAKIRAEVSARLEKFKHDPHAQFFPGGFIPTR